MKAIIVENFGRESVLQVEEVDIPEISNSKVLIKVETAGVNPVDTYIREGAFGYLPDLPYTPGKDGAGTIQAIGKNVTEFKVGDRVFFSGINLGRSGSYAEYCAVEVTNTFPLVDSLSFEEGAALGVPYFTAYRALVLKAKCNRKETVLIHGASGGVGLAAIQIAKSRGLYVIGTAGSPEGLKLIKELGCDHAIYHKQKNYIQEIQEITKDKGVNIIIEMLANKNLKNDLEMLAPNGRVMIVGNRGSVSIDPRAMMGLETSIIGVALLNSTAEEWQITTEAVLADIKMGTIKPIIDKTYSLAEAPSAHHDIIHNKGAKGKLIIYPSK